MYVYMWPPNVREYRIHAYFSVLTVSFIISFRFFYSQFTVFLNCSSFTISIVYLRTPMSQACVPAATTHQDCNASC